MFEDAKEDLIDALAEHGRPLPIAEAKDAIEGGEIMVESVLNRFATTEEGHVVAVDDGPTFSLDSEDDTEPAEGSAEPSEPEEDQSPSPEPEPAQRSAEERSWVAEDDHEVYSVNGLRITADPDEELVGQPTGDEFYGLPVLSNGHDGIPNETTPYFPVSTRGSRDSEEFAGRVLGYMVRPLLWEGEAGTGKNANINRMTSRTNRVVQRINFGSDISVFDLVGEKDFDETGSFFIVGKLAKAALFGHTAIFDEINMATGDVTSFIHAVTEKLGNRQLELRGTDVTLTDIPVSDDEIDRYGGWYEAARQKWTAADHLGKYIHPEFRVSATCNPLDYADTKEMNDAFRDRFVVGSHPYLEPDMEAKLLAEETDCDPSDVEDLCLLAKVLRDARKQANAITCPITHRSLLKTVELAGPSEEFMSFRAAALEVMVNHASTKSDKDYITDAIKDEL